MADGDNDQDKTEDPTQKKLDDALQKGDVVKSQEINTWFVLGGATLVLMIFSDGMSRGITTTMRGLLANSYAIPTDGHGLVSLTNKIGFEVLGAIAIPLLVLVLAAIGGNMIQHRLVWSAESLKPKLSKISPMAGFKRLFSKQSLLMFVKGLIKISLLGAIMMAIVWPQRDRLESLMSVDIGTTLAITKSMAVTILGMVVAVVAIIAAADFLFQYYDWYERQKMSISEVKEEYKQTEGDPAIKGRIRQLRQSQMRKRMMTNLPKASVIITNPTHFAVALQYERGMNAPLCVAKGVDAMAKRIRDVATEHGIPIIENPPLARALHATTEVDREVPPEHYKAVAEVIGYVMRLRRSFPVKLLIRGLARRGRHEAVRRITGTFSEGAKCTGPSSPTK